MATWRKALMVGLAVIVGPVLVLAQVDAGPQGTAAANQRTPVPLPNGNEMGNDELLQTDGEFWIAFAVAFCFGAAVSAWYQYYEDEDRGIDWDDAPAIVLGGAAMAGGYLVGYYAP